MTGVAGMVAQALALESARLHGETAELVTGSLVRALDRIRQHEESRRSVDNGRPLSRRAFCRILNIDIKTTLRTLMEQKLIKTVNWTKGEIRIPVSELKRLQRDGIPLAAQAKATFVPKSQRCASALASAREGAQAIRNLPIR